MVLLATALAGVEVTDPLDCLDTDRVHAELRLQLTDPVVDRLDITITTREPLQVATRVREDGVTLWSRTASFARADCPVIPEALALSVQQGLAGLPGWSFDMPDAPRVLSPTLHLAVSAGLPIDARFDARGGLRAVLAGPLELWAQARIATAPPVEVGSGAATIVHPAVAVGPALASPRGLRPDVWLVGSAGPLLAFGSRFDTDRVAVLPRAAVELGAGLHPGGPVHVGLFAEVPVARVRLEEANGDGVTESPVRVGLTVGIRPR